MVVGNDKREVFFRVATHRFFVTVDRDDFEIRQERAHQPASIGVVLDTQNSLRCFERCHREISFKLTDKKFGRRLVAKFIRQTADVQRNVRFTHRYDRRQTAVTEIRILYRSALNKSKINEQSGRDYLCLLSFREYRCRRSLSVRKMPRVDGSGEVLTWRHRTTSSVPTTAKPNGERG